MTELAPLSFANGDGPLADLSVLELVGEFGTYAGQLLSDLGAEVRRVAHPRSAADTEAALGELSGIDVLIRSGGADTPELPGFDPATIRSAHPRLIQAVLTPFGSDGPKAGCPSTDLIRLAAGGLLWLGGYPDGEPVAPYGGQSSLCTAIFAAIGVLLAVLERDHTGHGTTIDISAQEVLIQALETSLPEYELTGKVRRRAGSAPQEAGTGLYRCGDGYISMVAGRLGTARAWRRLREWLVEEDVPGAEELFEERWETLEFRQQPEAISRFAAVFGAFAETRGKLELYLEAQRRSIALAPVNTPSEVLVDPQLAARDFFREVPDEITGRPRTVPSPPYRFWAERDQVVAH
ncbi:MAG TPA: CoA transferase [Solirubrobacteraceae bacterium]|jgi:benzylsuccinate CoA-transferase BbsE subunit|nr:CoA transferase [Solirubrobacteraceae bacterium]